MAPPPSSLQVKCDQYWPTRGSETYGLIQVTLLDTVELAAYSVRTFALYKVKAETPGPPRSWEMFGIISIKGRFPTSCLVLNMRSDQFDPNCDENRAAGLVLFGL